jgi:endonuclease/exonuclease/phosphatase (EEP) superfamily protein YafD
MHQTSASAPTVRQGILRSLVFCGASLTTASCAYQYDEAYASRSSAATYEWSPAASEELDACRDLLSSAPVTDVHGLDAGNIRIAIWNVQKKHGQDWRRDYDELVTETDLVLMQEAPLTGAASSDFAAGRHWSFAPGHQVRGGVTGVLTLSSIEPLARCSFTAVEPWLRSPKATSITAYRLAATSRTLAVVNLHAVNFTVGVDAFRAQFRLIGEALRDHEGPIVVAGDFNTWRGRRLQVVDELAQSLGLRAVVFADDRRVRRFGYALDYIYVRDLQALETSTTVVDTSDHNPLSVTLGMSTGLAAP